VAGRGGGSVLAMVSVFPLSSGLLDASRCGGVQWGRGVREGFGVGSGEGAPEATGDLVLQAAQGFHHRLPISSKPFVVLLARSFEACLGDRDAVDRAVQLPVPAPVQPDSAFGLA